MATTDELLDVLMKDYKKPEDLIGENGLRRGDEYPPEMDLLLTRRTYRYSVRGY